jgi:hypothetical protein
MKKIMTILLIGLLLTISIFSPAEAALFILQPTDDTYVQRSGGNTNYDGGALLSSYSNLPTCVITRNAYLRFDISSYTENVGTNTSVRVFIVTAPANAGENISLYITGDDWNGALAGIGDETTLTWNNQPGAGTKLDTRTATGANTWVIFTSTNLITYVNSQRVANGGDNIVSFMITWDTCTALSNDVVFEDRENTRGSGVSPTLDPLSPTTVTVSEFSASPAYQNILVNWQTVSEVDLLGFNLYRSSKPGGPREMLNSSLIPAEGLGNPPGYSYEFMDTTVLAGHTYYYWLEMVFITGNKTLDYNAQATGNYVAFMPVIQKPGTTLANNSTLQTNLLHGR